MTIQTQATPRAKLATHHQPGVDITPDTATKPVAATHQRPSTVTVLGRHAAMTESDDASGPFRFGAHRFRPPVRRSTRSRIVGRGNRSHPVQVRSPHMPAPIWRRRLEQRAEPAYLSDVRPPSVGPACAPAVPTGQ